MGQHDELKKRLQFQVRRGMLELDIFLQRFLNERFDALSAADQSAFCDLLKENDQDLFVWLTGRETPSNQRLAAMVQEVRDHVCHQ
ncbi:MAG: response regulator receiver protein [Gammaproteobacteria bacterium CG11_big_fil_rev_8_21_14_0_20_46_22]|nr:MAG: response regulator receiver protein [Gammaproteobacteria bacterium CG12_big_fil_rev_8_21_14_0_65_46_12]PIR11436.1 MAG: response regulator receiver protein [Gammaproteobacteria bacterium CG11_big_fil_rev_8_21_14_0_20_46_22]